jgi:ElaB/YqjD/DUF883 family membrane-anchored ribosome-binding protein
MRNGRRAGGGRHHTPYTRIAGQVRNFGRVAANGASSAAATIGDKSRQIFKAAGRLTSQIKAYLTANPAKSALIAVGLGATVGFLLRRRRD